MDNTFLCLHLSLCSLVACFRTTHYQAGGFIFLTYYIYIYLDTLPSTLIIHAYRAAHLSEAKATMVETQTMMKRLTTMHKEHIEKQSLFDNGMEQEHAIEIETSKITQSFHRCQKLIQAISRKSGLSESQAGQRLGKSAASAAARDLQDLSMTFRKSQASYLKRTYLHLRNSPLSAERMRKREMHNFGSFHSCIYFSSGGIAAMMNNCYGGLVQCLLQNSFEYF